MNSSAPFWIEVLSHSGSVIARHRVTAGAATIGRGYTNDVVIDDAFVAPAHLRIAYAADDGAEMAQNPPLWLDDLDTGNGTFDLSSQSNITRVQVGDEATVRIGHTHVRIRRSSFDVAPALALPQQASAAPVVPAASPPAIGHGTAALAMIALFIAAIEVSTWLSQTGEFKLAAYLPGGVILPLMVLGWAGIWTLLTRLVTSNGQFFRHVAIAFAFMLVLFAFDIAFDFVGYAFAWTSPQKWLPLLAWVIFGALCFAHIRAIAPKHNRLVGGILGALVVIAIGVHVSLRAEAERVQTQRISAKLMPPFLQMKSPVDPDAFFKGALALKPKLDEERKKEPTTSAFSLADFD